jgi:hypothetical protein
MLRAVILTLASALLIADAVPVAAQACRAPTTVADTVLKMKYCVDPAFAGVMDTLLQRLRQEVRAARQAGRLIVYSSTPISPRGGGVTKVNTEIARSVKERLEKTLGPGAWVLDPGAYQVPKVEGREPGGGDYMVMFVRLLAGDDGAGRDFDMVHFTGPTDMRAFFGCTEDVIGCLSRWLAARAATDPELRPVADGPEARRAFLRYYAMRASAAFSAGARDEWNIFVKINRGRRVGDQVAMFFDGRPVGVGEMDTEISGGYEVR